jgi:hypothetical protein
MSETNERIGLNLGDIINIINNERPELNRTFLIEYIDDNKIKIVDDKDRYILTINEDLSIDDGNIENIELLYRNPLEGYALQNNLTPGSWVTVYFDGNDVTGEIVSLEEDMIGIMTPDGVIYIDFSYRGLPEDIISIEHTERRDQMEMEMDQMDQEMDTDQGDYLIMKRDLEPEIVFKPVDADVYFGDYMDEVVEYYNVESKYKRYSLEEQTNDMVEDLLSVIPDDKRTRDAINSVNTMVERYVQLLKEFSIYDDDNNIVSSEKKGTNYRPLVHSLYKFKKSLFWIIPVAKNIKKNMIGDTDEKEDDTMEQLNELKLIIESYKSLDVENSYESFVKRLQSWFIPFLNLDFNDTGEIIINKRVKENFNVMINNLGNYETKAVTCDTTCEFIKKKFLFMNYITYNSMIQSDSLFLQSLITLPEPIVRFSRVNLPGTDILTKSNISRFFINYGELLKMTINKINVTPHLKGECLIGGNEDQIESSLYDDKVRIDDDGRVSYYSNGFVNNIKDYYLNMDVVNRDSTCDLYEEYLTTIIPKTRQLFHLMKKYISGKMSIFKIISTLEPFLIYSSDISFSQYIEMAKFLDEEITKYIKLFVEKTKAFQLLKTQKNIHRPNKIAAIFGNHPELYTPILEKVYGYNEDHHLSNIELLRKIISLDYGYVYNYAIRQYSLSLNNANVGKKLADDLDTLLNEIATEELSGECKKLQFAKRYYDLDSLKKDDNKEIYYDREFDRTPYSIVDNYEKERRNMNDIDFYNFIRKKLISLHNVSEENAPYVIETIRAGRKKVNNMDYAIIYNHDNQIISYFVRKNDVWEEDNVNNQPVTDELACILRETCNYKKDECMSIEQDAKEIMATSIQKISNEFDKKYEKTIEENKSFTEKMLKYYTFCIPKIKEIDKYRLLQYTLKEYSEGLTIEDIELKQSPNAALRDKILGQSDIVKKYEDILKFVEKYTLSMNKSDFKTVDVYNELTGEEFEKFTREKNIQSHWLYCKETKIRILPKFYFYLAKTFIDNPSEYARRLDLLCFSIGKKSDDGDKYVDKYSGYTIRVIDFAKEYGETEDIEIEPVFEVEEKNMSLMERRVLNIVKTMESNMHINLQHDHPFILSTVTQAYNSITISEKEFNEFIAQRDKKKEKSYKDYSNANLLYLTLGVFFIAIQTNIPEIKFKYSFPGCRKSFTGYPLTKDDENGLEYIACVASKIKSTIPPWNVLKGKKDVADINKIKKELKKMIEDNLIPDLGVKDRILLRIQNKDSHILDMGMVVDNEHSVSKWVHFMPAIIPFRVKEITPISESFKTNLSTMVKTGNRRQIDSVEAIKGKIIFYAYYFQNIIQEIISKKTLLTNSNQPFINNCCNDKNGISCLQYFEEENSDIVNINNIIESLASILRDISKLTQSRTLYSNIDTKNVTYVQNNRTYNEDVIIRALMIINKYITFPELQNEEVYRNKVNEKIEEGISFTTEEFVKDLKKIGSEQRVFYREKLPVTPLSIFHEIIKGEELEKIVEEGLEDVNNFLSIKNDEYIKIICDFIYENHRFKKDKNREIREIRDILSLGNWKKIETTEGFYKNIHFLQNMIYLFSRVFPWIILNKQNHKITIPYYWGLSKTDDLKIKACIEKYYSDLEPFFSDPQSDPFYKSLNETVMNIEKYFMLSEVTKGNRGEGIFGEYTSLLLQKYYLLSIFHKYIVSANSKTTEVVENELLISGKSRALKKQISGLLYFFIQHIKNNKVTQNIQYEEIMERVFLLKEKEKETFTERLERKDEYEREVDNVMKQFGLGDWGKGNKKTLFQYSKYDEDDVLKEKIAWVEAKLFSVGNSITESNIDQYIDDELQEMVNSEFIEEDNDLSGILDDYANNFEEE